MGDYLIIDNVKLTKIEGAKTLQLAHYNGLTFAVDLNCNENDLYVIFLPDGRISEEYAQANNLISRIDPQTGKNTGGFFGKNRKVRTIKLMKGQIVSCGYIARLDSLAFTGYDLSKLKKGETFESLNGVPIVSKFINEATRNVINNRKIAENIKTKILLNEHVDTSMFMKNIDNIPENSRLIITEKLDGTSVRIGNVKEVQNKQSIFSKLMSKINYIKKDRYLHVTGTRRVIIRETNHGGYYGDHAIYTEIGKALEGKLNHGEIIYGEIVGWLSENKPLFKRGETIMQYGCAPGTRKFFVYAITREIHGETIQAPWSEVKRRCKELSLQHVPEFTTVENYNESIKDLVVENVVEYAKGLSTLDSSHIKEGVVIRVENGFQSYFLKYKTPEFYELEDKSKSDDSYIDMEESQEAC